MWNPMIQRQLCNSLPRVPILSQMNPLHTLPFPSCPSTRPGHPTVLFTSGFLSKPCMHLYFPPYVPHDPPITFSFILSPERYLVCSKGHDTSCLVAKGLLSLAPSHCSPPAAPNSPKPPKPTVPSVCNSIFTPTNSSRLCSLF